MLWILLALGCVGFGLYVGLGEPETVVEGDAYNYFIAGIRGLPWIGLGVLFGLSTVCAFLADRE